MNLREQIIAADDRPIESVDVPEWDCTVYVRAMSGTARDAIEQQWAQRDKANPIDNARARVLVHSLCDEDGALVFAVSDITELGQKSAVVLDRLFAIAQRLSGLTGADIEDAEKNSDDHPSDDSGTA